MRSLLLLHYYHMLYCVMVFSFQQGKEFTYKDKDVVQRHTYAAAKMVSEDLIS